jgi:fibronectin-binding autotransporter adhesin
LVRKLRVVVPLILGVAAATEARAGNLYWDNDANAANNSVVTGVGLGGTGTWDTSALKWFNGTSDVAWTNGNDAIFWGTAGNVTLGAAQSVNSLTFKSNGYFVDASTLTLGGSSITVDTGAETINSTLAGTTGLVKNGNGNLHLSHANTYTGGTTINGGLLGIVAQSTGPLPGSPQVDITINNGATLRFNAADLTLHINRQILLGTGGGVVNTNGFNDTIDGIINGSSLAKSGLGSLKLTNANTYTGGTTVSTGTLLVNNTAGSGTGTGAVAVNAGATLGGTGTIAGAVTVNSGGHIAPGTSIESLDVGSLILASGSVLDFELNTVSGIDTSDLINVNTADGLTINGGTLNITNVGMTGGTYKLIDYSGTLNGNVSNIALGNVPANFSYSLVNNTSGTSIDLVVVSGDFNDDKSVNSADYPLWRKGLDTTYTQNDYNIWRGNFGLAGGSGASYGAGGSLGVVGGVPEPGSLSLCVVLSGLWVAFYCKRGERQT